MADTVNTSIRIPTGLHDRLRRAAETERRSVNQLITLAVESWLDQYEREGYPGKITSTRTPEEWAEVARRYGAEQEEDEDR